MRILVLVLIVYSALNSFGQELVSGAIISYHGGAYEQCIEAMTKSLKNSASLDVPTKAKAYYYRGMARIKLMSNANSPFSGDVLQSILDDLGRAKSLDNQWTQRANAEIVKITTKLQESARADYERAILSKDMNINRPLLSGASDKLLSCLQAAKSASTLELLGKVHQAHGNVYYNMAEVGDPMEVQRQYLAHFTMAIGYFEERVNLENGTPPIYSALLELSVRIGDKDREGRYAYLAAQTGG